MCIYAVDITAFLKEVGVKTVLVGTVTIDDDFNEFEFC